MSSHSDIFTSFYHDLLNFIGIENADSINNAADIKTTELDTSFNIMKDYVATTFRDTTINDGFINTIVSSPAINGASNPMSHCRTAFDRSSN